jgi:putative transposase
MGTNYTTGQILAKLRTAQALEAQGHTMAAMCRKLGINELTLRRWLMKYGDLAGDEVERLRQLEAENIRLRRLVADVEELLTTIKGLTRPPSTAATTCGACRWG